MQDPVVCGVLTGVSPAGGYKLTPEGKFLSRNINKGFNDPRRFTPSDYDGTPDGGTPTQSSKRSVGLKNALDTAPIEPESIKIDYEGKVSAEDWDIVSMLPFQNFTINANTVYAESRKKY